MFSSSLPLLYPTLCHYKSFSFSSMHLVTGKKLKCKNLGGKSKRKKRKPLNWSIWIGRLEILSFPVQKNAIVLRLPIQWNLNSSARNSRSSMMWLHSPFKSTLRCHCELWSSRAQALETNSKWGSDPACSLPYHMTIVRSLHLLCDPKEIIYTCWTSDILHVPTSQIRKVK